MPAGETSALRTQRSKPGSFATTPESTMPVTVAALYQFAPFPDPAALKPALEAVCREGAIKGTLLLANEGINGTVAGSADSIRGLLDHIRSLPGCGGLDVKFSSAPTMPFHRMKVRLKREIVTMGRPDIDPRAAVGTYVDPAEWNELIANPETVVIDTRNDYEVAIGTFARAVDPGTTSFRDFPEWFRQNRDALIGPGTKVAMFCTGGIRCEKSTAFLKSEGVEQVYHLKGGILRYLEEVPPELSLWQGECFVFDERVSVGHGLTTGKHSLCRACRRPLSEADRASSLYEPGASCPGCYAEHTDEQRSRHRERWRQQQLAERRGTTHIGI